MAIKRNNNSANHSDPSSDREIRSSVPNDLPDSSEDEKKLQVEATYIDLPDVKDIPGQEFIHPLPLGSLADTTISSDDEEGKNIFGEDEDTGFVKSPDADII